MQKQDFAYQEKKKKKKPFFASLPFFNLIS